MLTAMAGLVLNEMVNAELQLPSLYFTFDRAWAILAYMSDFCGHRVRICNMPRARTALVLICLECHVIVD